MPATPATRMPAAPWDRGGIPCLGGGDRWPWALTHVWRRAKRAALYVWCDVLRETLCVPSIYRRVRVRSCTAGQVTSVNNRFRYDLWRKKRDVIVLEERQRDFIVLKKNKRDVIVLKKKKSKIP